MGSATDQCVVTVEVTRADSASYRLRYGYGSLGEDRIATVPADTLEDLLELAETHYYLSLPDDLDERQALLEACGHKLYTFLDTPERLLSGFRDRTYGSWNAMALSVTAEGRLAHLPWELLHDGEHFLVAAPNPIVPVRRVRGLSPVRPAHQPPLRMMFMACAPMDDDGLSSLDYQAEEAQIDAATRRYAVELQVEESGDVDGLAERLAQHEYFDAVHITGHAGHSVHGPVFAMEDPRGRRIDVDAERLLHALAPTKPTLLFLSGCRTAEASDVFATVSLAEKLAVHSAPVVLGWGRPVADATATGAAAVAYRLLAQGRTIAEALSSTYRDLMAKGDPYWHTLRAFVRGEAPAALVAATRIHGDGFLPRPLWPRDSDLAPSDTKRFVGRRREVQEALRLLDPRADPVPIGLIVYGMGGVGKTTLVERIRDRLGKHYRVVFIHKDLREKELLEALGSDPDRAMILDEIPARLPLTQRLISFLRRYSQHNEQLLLFVLDEFEHNFRPDRMASGEIVLVDGHPQTLPDTAQTLTALVDAVRQCGYGPHRILMTTRYMPHLTCVRHFAVRQLHGFSESEINRLLTRLQADPPWGGPVAGIEQPVNSGALQEIREIAAGNPRLLNWLFEVARLNYTLDLDALRALLREKKRVDFLDKNIYAPMLLDRIDPAERRLLETAAPFHRPVADQVLARIAADKPERVSQRVRDLAALGLLELVKQPDGTARFCLPGAMRSQFLIRNDPQAERSRHATCAVELAAELGEFLDEPNPQRLDRETLREVHRLARAGAHLSLALDTAVALADIEHSRMQFQAAAEICQSMLTMLNSLKRHPDHRLFLALAEAEGELGHPADSRLYFDKALASYPPDAPQDRAAILASKGFWTNEIVRGSALAELDEAIALARAHGSERTLVFALRTKARALADRPGDAKPAQVQVLLDEAMRLAQHPGQSAMAPATVRLDRAIALHLNGGDIEEAHRDLRAALETYNRVGARLNGAIALLTLAESAVQRDLLDEAEQLVDEAVLGNRSVRVEVGVELARGQIAWFRDALNQATQHYEKARALAHEIGNLNDELAALLGLQSVYRDRGDTAALTELREALDGVLAELNSPERRVEVLLDSLVEDRRAGTIDASTAVERAREAATIAAAVGWVEREVQSWQLFVDDADDAEVPAMELDAALRRLLVLLREQGSPDTPDVAGRLGRQLLRRERLAEAQPLLEEALEHYEGCGQRRIATELHERLAEVARGRQRTSDAEVHLRAATIGHLDAGYGSSHSAVQTLRQLATLQRAQSLDDAEGTLVQARVLARLLPSGLDEEQILADLADIADERAEAAGTQSPWTEVADSRRRQAREARQRALPLAISIGEELVRHFDPAKGGDFFKEVEKVRAELTVTSQWTMPGVRASVDAELDKRGYILRIWGERVTEGVVDNPMDAIDVVSAHLRDAARTRRSQIEAGEKPPPADPDIDCSTVDGVVARLRAHEYRDS